MAEVTCYLLIDPPGSGQVNLNSAKVRGKNASPRPIDRPHARISLDGTHAIVHGTWDEADLAWLLAKGWARRYDQAGILEYLAANRAAWESEVI